MGNFYIHSFLELRRSYLKPNLNCTFIRIIHRLSSLTTGTPQCAKTSAYFTSQNCVEVSPVSSLIWDSLLPETVHNCPICSLYYPILSSLRKLRIPASQGLIQRPLMISTVQSYLLVASAQFFLAMNIVLQSSSSKPELSTVQSQ